MTASANNRESVRKKSLRLFGIKGVDVRIHFSWVIVFLVYLWWVTQVYFPDSYPYWRWHTVWITGVVTVAGIFVSVLLHELAHSLTAVARGIKVHDINMFILGGVSYMEKEPAKPVDDLMISLAGPFANLILGGLGWLALVIINPAWAPAAAVLTLMVLVNLILGILNLLPCLPLDGGRILRAVLWQAAGSYRRATKVMVLLSLLLCAGLFMIGVILLVNGKPIMGIWLAAIGIVLGIMAIAERNKVEAAS